jgi:hypothetical protein
LPGLVGGVPLPGFTTMVTSSLVPLKSSKALKRRI